METFHHGKECFVKCSFSFVKSWVSICVEEWFRHSLVIFIIVIKFFQIESSMYYIISYLWPNSEIQIFHRFKFCISETEWLKTILIWYREPFGKCTVAINWYLFHYHLTLTRICEWTIVIEVVLIKRFSQKRRQLCRVTPILCWPKCELAMEIQFWNNILDTKKKRWQILFGI